MDNETGRTWELNIDMTPRTWEEAKTYCQNLPSDAGAWRLPTIQELQTLIDESRVNPAIDTSAFPNTPKDFFWSSSAYASEAGTAWIVYFGDGYVDNYGVDNGYLVRCVR